jgi:DNA-binding response OmpR family regulator
MRNDMASDRLKTIFVLIVDDEEGIRDLLKDEFELHGARVDVAADAATAFEKIKASRYDAVLSDIRMPGGDGLTLFRRVKDLLNDAHPPFFFMSAFSDVSREKILAQGARDLFAKPFDLDDVFNTVHEAVRR